MIPVKLYAKTSFPRERNISHTKVFSLIICFNLHFEDGVIDLYLERHWYSHAHNGSEPEMLLFLIAMTKVLLILTCLSA